MLTFVQSVMVIFGVLLSVTFYTLYERKLLGYIHTRKGPNIVSISGLLQPFADAVKLFLKESPTPVKCNMSIYFVSPLGALGVALGLWLISPCSMQLMTLYCLIVVFLVATPVSVYLHFGCGWGSNSAYGLIGALRSVAQTISYEVSMAFIIVSLGLIVGSLSLTVHEWASQFSALVLLAAPGLSLMWLLSCVAETNRAPFDFAEGESELVSGFNIEYGGGLFALLFIAEYASMIFLSVLSSFLLLSWASSSAWYILAGMGLMCLLVWLRGSLPRTRYDKLMILCWASVLPASLWYFMYFAVVLVH